MNSIRFSFIVLVGCATVLTRPSASAQETVTLEDGWLIFAGAHDGKNVSSKPYQYGAKAAFPARVPTTVLAALVDDGEYGDIYFGTNLAAISADRFKDPWWFRKEFTVSKDQAAENAGLIFEGINYRANIWLNGRRIAAANEVFGAYRMFRFDVTGKLADGTNVIAVEVFPPVDGDFTMGFVDWNPKPADAGMGLFRPVKLHFYRGIALDDVFVQSRIDHADWEKAELTVHATLRNDTKKATETTVTGTISDQNFSEHFKLVAGERRVVEFKPGNHPGLKFDHPALWWPWELGQPFLHTLHLAASSGSDVADSVDTRFGIREVSDYITPDGYRGYMVNGKKLLIRGGGWADELLLRENRTNLEAQVRYTRAMNLNTIRCEGFWGSSQMLYDLADENGVLVMPGFSCQWEWEDYLGKKCDEKYGGFQSPAEMALATNYLQDQVVWLRNHPSIFAWVLGSDKLPKPELEKRYDALLRTIDPTRPTLKSCGSVTSSVSGPSAVKMNGPYDYVTPNYWYLDKKHGGAFGFNTETGPGPQPPTLETLQRMIPTNHLWPIDDTWNYHAGRHEFAQMNRYLTAFTNRYGPVSNVDEFTFKAQAANYEAIRPMFESFAVNLPHTTGIVQWMLNPSWPKLYWQLYDYYLVPGGAFFGAKHGAAAVALIYNYGDHGIYLANQTDRMFAAFATTITVYDANSKVILEQTITNTDVGYGSHKVFDLSGIKPETPVYFVDLAGIEQRSAPMDPRSARNFYWLSTKPDVLDDGKTEWFVTPNRSYADFTALNRLPEAKVVATADFREPDSHHYRTTGINGMVTLTNTTDNLAFFIEMRVVGKESQRSLTPVFWGDNYVSLPGHASRSYWVRFPKGETPELKLRGWNVTFNKP